MGVGRWFYRSEQELLELCERLKQMPCPYCKRTGTLNRHGTLSGYDESNSRRRTVRARRVFCSNRNARPGCGRTFSIWLVDKIRRLSLTTGCLFQFLKLAVANGVAAAVRTADCQLSDRTLQRIWTRFQHAQSKIRTALSQLRQPSQLAADTVRTPAAEVLSHLQTAFPNARCPIAAFQHATRSFFL